MKVTDRAALYVSILRHEPTLQRKSFALVGANVSMMKSDDGVDVVSLHLTEEGARALIASLQGELARMDEDLEHLSAVKFA